MKFTLFLAALVLQVLSISCIQIQKPTFFPRSISTEIPLVESEIQFSSLQTKKQILQAEKLQKTNSLNQIQQKITDYEAKVCFLKKKQQIAQLVKDIHRNSLIKDEFSTKILNLKAEIKCSNEQEKQKLQVKLIDQKIAFCNVYQVIKKLNKTKESFENELIFVGTDEMFQLANAHLSTQNELKNI